MRRWLILNSRQSLYPHGGLVWVQQTSRAVAMVAKQSGTLLVTTGAPTWELLLACAAQSGVSVEVVIDDRHDPLLRVRTVEHFRDEFGLSEPTLIVTSAAPPNDGSAEPEIHQELLSRADRICPVSIRPNGLLASLIQTAPPENVDRRFETAYQQTRHRAQNLTGTTACVTPFDPAEYLFHWTRTARRSLPGQTRCDFYQALLKADCYPYTAFSILKRILEQRSLLASSRHMRGKTSVVALTGKTPSEMLPLMRWRRRYREMSFEPYGIGVHRRWAAAAGIRPVRYVGADMRRGEATDAERWLEQGRGIATDWQTEHEFRVRGNLALPGQSPELVAMTATKAEAEEIALLFSIRCGWFQSAP